MDRSDGPVPVGLAPMSSHALVAASALAWPSQAGRTADDDVVLVHYTVSWS